MNPHSKTRRSGLLKSVEGFILELLLVTYFLHLIVGPSSIHPHYLLIGMAFLGGLIAYFIFIKRPYTVLLNLAISLIITVPFVLTGLPWIVNIILFTIVSWRFHVHFGLERSGHLNFLALNTVIMTTLYLVAKAYLLKADVVTTNLTQIKLFVVTTLLFIGLRYAVITLEDKWQNHSGVKEITRVFGGVTLAAGAVFFFIYYAIESVRNVVLAFLGLTFGNLFITIASLLPSFEEVGEGGAQGGGESDGITFAPEKETVRVTSESGYLGIVLLIISVILLVIFLLVFLKKRKRDYIEGDEPKATFRKKDYQRKPVQQVVQYDYSKSTNEIRMAMQRFEEAASVAMCPRFMDETIKEWFKRMKWSKNDALFSLYDQVRYGNQSISEVDKTKFIEMLNAIKQTNFNKNV